MVEFMKSRFSDGSVDNIVFQPQATGGPSGGETIIRLPDDVIIDASTDLFVDPLNPDGHVGCANFLFGDGSVRDEYNPYITVDFVEGI